MKDLHFQSHLSKLKIPMAVKVVNILVSGRCGDFNMGRKTKKPNEKKKTKNLYEDCLIPGLNE